TEYGGEPSSGGTHLALLGFDVGSYIELIAAHVLGVFGGMWATQVAGDAGPCAWAARSSGIAAEAARLAALGIPVRGPLAMHRRRPDGTRVEWELAFPGDGTPGNTLPFLIEDTTPRALRVLPSPAVAGSELRGVGQVVLGVERLAPAAELFCRAYGWPAPDLHDDASFGARLARFSGTPVTLAEPLPGAEGAWLAARLARFGPAPCAFLLASADLAASTQRMGLGLPADWCGRPAAWVPEGQRGAAHVGAVTSDGRSVG
ncbi:MAG: VOC family protein, partial [Ktedonobacterales bacterium]